MFVDFTFSSTEIEFSDYSNQSSRFMVILYLVPVGGTKHVLPLWMGLSYAIMPEL